MTISTNTLRRTGPTPGNGVTTAFPFAWKVFAESEVTVVELVTATGVETTKAITTHYTVALNADQDANPGGTVNAVAAPASTVKWTLVSGVQAVQPADLLTGGGYYPVVIENELDRAIILIQQITETGGRVLTLPVSTALDVDATLPAPVANRVIGWNSLGTALVNYANNVADWLSDLAAPTGASLVGYLLAGVGAVATTVQGKLRESVSVLDFYANGSSGVAVDPTGVVDSTLGIQAAYDYCVANFKSLLVPRGTYKTTSTLTFNNVSVDFDGSTIIYEGPVNSFALVFNALLADSSNPGAVYENLTVQSASTDVVNRTHGLCLGGSVGVLRNFRAIGFTGISLALGSGTEIYTTNVVLPASAQCYYWSISNINFRSTHGWNLVVRSANNANTFDTISSWPWDGFTQAVPRPHNAINTIVVNGYTNVFRNVSVENAPSGSYILFNGYANANIFEGVTYYERNVNWLLPPMPLIFADANTAANRISMWNPFADYTSLPIIDNGVANDFGFICVEGTSPGGPLVDLPAYTSTPKSSVSLLKNGDFSNLSKHWSNLSTGTTTSNGVGFVNGKSTRLDIVAGRPSFLQDLVVSGFPLSGILGRTVTISCWAKSDLLDAQVRFQGILSGLRSPAKIIGNGIWNYITGTYKVIDTGFNDAVLNFTTESASVTGYIEFSNVTVVMGTTPLAVDNPSVIDNNSYSWNPVSIAAGAQTLATTTVLGAELGDFAVASMSIDLLLLQLTAYVSAANVVTVLLANHTAGAIDLGAGTLRVKVIKK